jgi:hypothetical protein
MSTTTTKSTTSAPPVIGAPVGLFSKGFLDNDSLFGSGSGSSSDGEEEEEEDEDDEDGSNNDDKEQHESKNATAVTNQQEQHSNKPILVASSSSPIVADFASAWNMSSTGRWIYCDCCGFCLGMDHEQHWKVDLLSRSKKI